MALFLLDHRNNASPINFITFNLYLLMYGSVKLFGFFHSSSNFSIQALQNYFYFEKHMYRKINFLFSINLKLIIAIVFILMSYFI